MRLRKFFLSCLRMQDCCVSAWMILTVRLWEVKNICGCNSDWMQTVLQSVFRRQSDEAAAVDLHGSDGDSVPRAACEIPFRARVFSRTRMFRSRRTFTGTPHCAFGHCSCPYCALGSESVFAPQSKRLKRPEKDH